MKAILGEAKDLCIASVHLLNQPVIKEGIKNLAGTVTFVLGLVEIYNIYQITRGQKISADPFSNSSKWMRVANKLIIVCAKISLILSAGVSRPGVYIISSLIESVFSTSQLEYVFGPNTLFALNPWHPRHIVSILAVILSLPTLAQSTYESINWTYKKIRHYRKASTNRLEIQTGPTDSKIKLTTLFNTITSRPTLHIGNQLGRFILRRI